MVSLPILWIRARAYCHATEEEDRVACALDAVCPAGEDRREVLEGQHGNPIVHLARRLADAKAIRRTWALWDRAGILSAIRPDVDARTDADGVLHFRIDKQRAFEGRLELAKEEDSVDVQVKIEAYPARAEEIRRVARELLSEAA